MSNSHHIPMRTCVACRAVGPKRDMVRFIRNAVGGVEADAEGCGEGRGAYLCRSADCWRLGLKGGRLAHSLKTEITADDRRRLWKYAEIILGELIVGRGKEDR